MDSEGASMVGTATALELMVEARLVMAVPDAALDDDALSPSPMLDTSGDTEDVSLTDELEVTLPLAELDGVGVYDSAAVTEIEVLTESEAVMDADGVAVEVEVMLRLAEVVGDEDADLDGVSDSAAVTEMEALREYVAVMDADRVTVELEVTLRLAEVVCDEDRDTTGVLELEEVVEPEVLAESDGDSAALTDDEGLQVAVRDDVEDRDIVEVLEAVMEDDGDRELLTDAEGATVALGLRLMVAVGVSVLVLDGDGLQLSDTVGEGVALNRIAVALVDPAGHS